MSDPLGPLGRTGEAGQRRFEMSNTYRVWSQPNVIALEAERAAQVEEFLLDNPKNGYTIEQPDGLWVNAEVWMAPRAVIEDIDDKMADALTVASLARYLDVTVPVQMTPWWWNEPGQPAFTAIPDFSSHVTAWGGSYERVRISDEDFARYAAAYEAEWGEAPELVDGMVDCDLWIIKRS